MEEVGKWPRCLKEEATSGGQETRETRGLWERCHHVEQPPYEGVIHKQLASSGQREPLLCRTKERPLLFPPSLL